MNCIFCSRSRLFNCGRVYAQVEYADWSEAMRKVIDFHIPVVHRFLSEANAPDRHTVWQHAPEIIGEGEFTMLKKMTLAAALAVVGIAVA